MGDLETAFIDKEMCMFDRLIKRIADKVLAIINYVLTGGPLNGYKTALGGLLYILEQFVPGFPTVEITDGLSADEILLIWGAIHKLIKAVKK